MTRLIINAETGTEIEVDLTAEELAEREILQAEAVAREAAKVAKEAARESRRQKLLALGLTEEEVDA